MKLRERVPVRWCICTGLTRTHLFASCKAAAFIHGRSDNTFAPLHPLRIWLPRYCHQTHSEGTRLCWEATGETGEAGHGPSRSLCSSGSNASWLGLLSSIQNSIHSETRPPRNQLSASAMSAVCSTESVPHPRVFIYKNVNYWKAMIICPSRWISRKFHISWLVVCLFDTLQYFFGNQNFTSTPWP